MLGKLNRYLIRLGIFLITAALIAGMAGCVPTQYNLAMAGAPGGSGTATDLTNASPYAAGTVVNITAAAAAGYQFVNWTTPAGTFGNKTAATTTFTMPAQNVTVTANFVVVYDLTMAVAGGNGTATDLTNASPYAAGTVVSIQAVADPGYRFVNWTAPAGTFGNKTAATTTFTMPGQDVTITANFEPHEFYGGNGTAGDPYQIADWHQLDCAHNYLDSYFVLVNNLYSTTAGYDELASPTSNGGKGWQPIGSWNAPFTGSFDGQGYEIRDLFINRPGETNVGLFGVVGQGGVIKETGVTNATVIGRNSVGGLMGGNMGTVSNSYFTGSVTGTGMLGSTVGGLVGLNDGTVINSYSTGSVTGEWFVGGLVGENWGTVSDSYSVGSVTGEWFAGGLVGNNGGTVSNCYATTSVTGEDCVGGLVGLNIGTVSDSYSTGNVTGNSSVGGLVGFNYEEVVVSNSYYNYDEVLINGESVITSGALFGEDFEQWLANGKFLDVNERLSQENGYYVVNNISDFKELLAFGQNATLKFRLANDLDLATEPNFYIPYFAGEFDGNGHIISNLSFNFDFVSNVGLFGYLASGGKVTDLGVESANITGYRNVGGLVGENNGTVSNSYATGNVNGGHGVGGLVGENYGTVSNSYSTCSVTANVSTVVNVSVVGGLVGYNNDYAEVSNSYATGSVTGTSYVGGLVGYNDDYAEVSNSYSNGNVTGDEYVGGLVGGNEDGTVIDSFWDTETSGQATSDGGTGKTTTEMKNILTFSGAMWDIIAVALNETNPTYIWNIVNNVTYPFLSWQS